MLPLGNVPNVDPLGRGVHLVEKLLPLVHPNLGDAGRVLEDRVAYAARERVRALVPKHVAHVRAGDDLQLPAAHPDAERHLQVLPAPHLHALVVRANLVEVVPVDREQAAGHGRRSQRGRPVSASPEREKSIFQMKHEVQRFV